MKDRQILAALNFCRELLFLRGVLTDTENAKVHSRIKKFQDRKCIEISEAQLLSVELTYDDNAKE